MYGSEAARMLAGVAPSACCGVWHMCTRYPAACLLPSCPPSHKQATCACWHIASISKMDEPVIHQSCMCHVCHLYRLLQEAVAPYEQQQRPGGGAVICCRAWLCCTADKRINQ